MNGSRRSHRYLIMAAAPFLLAALHACGDDDTSVGPTLTITAPTLVGPASGSQVDEEQPTLVVNNATVSDGSIPTYSFQVATDSAFADIVAQDDGVAQGTGGQTSWQVPEPLANLEHFWRARASVSGTRGPFSETGDFVVAAPFKSNEPRDGVLVYDPLTNGSSVGEVGGGEFTDQGWKVTSRTNFIRYEVPTIESGFFEIDMTGLTPRNKYGDKRTLFIMWDPGSSGNFTTNPFRVSVLKHSRQSTEGNRYFRLRWISNREQHDVFNGFIGWVQDEVYHFRLEWGPEGGKNTARLLMNGQEMHFLQYRRPYRPIIHRLELGAAMRAETYENAVYSHVRIGIR